MPVGEVLVQCSNFSGFIHNTASYLSIVQVRSITHLGQSTCNLGLQKPYMVPALFIKYDVSWRGPRWCYDFNRFIYHKDLLSNITHRKQCKKQHAIRVQIIDYKTLWFPYYLILYDTVQYQLARCWLMLQFQRFHFIIQLYHDTPQTTQHATIDYKTLSGSCTRTGMLMSPFQRYHLSQTCSINKPSTKYNITHLKQCNMQK